MKYATGPSDAFASAGVSAVDFGADASRRHVEKAPSVHRGGVDDDGLPPEHDVHRGTRVVGYADLTCEVVRGARWDDARGRPVVPSMPLSTSFTVPSPPHATIVSAPASIASRAKIAPSPGSHVTRGTDDVSLRAHPFDEMTQPGELGSRTMQHERDVPPPPSVCARAVLRRPGDRCLARELHVFGHSSRLDRYLIVMATDDYRPTSNASQWLSLACLRSSAGPWDSTYHAPVLADEVVRLLAGARSVLDGTLGGGGHSLALLASGSDVTASIAIRKRSTPRDDGSRATRSRVASERCLATTRMLDVIPELEGHAGSTAFSSTSASRRISSMIPRAASRFAKAFRSTCAWARTPFAMRRHCFLPRTRSSSARSSENTPTSGAPCVSRARSFAGGRIGPFATSDDLVGAIRGALGPRTGPPDFAGSFRRCASR